MVIIEIFMVKIIVNGGGYGRAKKAIKTQIFAYLFTIEKFCERHNKLKIISHLKKYKQVCFVGSMIAKNPKTGNFWEPGFGVFLVKYIVKIQIQ